MDSLIRDPEKSSFSFSFSLLFLEKKKKRVKKRGWGESFMAMQHMYSQFVLVKIRISKYSKVKGIFKCHFLLENLDR